jgi:hypothetical protein
MDIQPQQSALACLCDVGRRPTAGVGLPWCPCVQKRTREFDVEAFGFSRVAPFHAARIQNEQDLRAKG